MTLREAVEELDTLGRERVLFVRRPWGPASECVSEPLTESYGIPSAVRDAGFEYFLEVPTAREVLGVLGQRRSNLDSAVQLLLHYAEHDAYPDWVYR